MKLLIATTCVLLISSSILADPIKDNNVDADQQNGLFSKCLESDSISCLQLTAFRKAKAIFDNPQIEIFGGVSLIKSNDGRQGKSLEDNAIAVETAPTIEARNAEMGNYLLNHAKNFFIERSLNLNFANAARSVARAIPDDIKADIRELVVESRTKKKKLLKKFLPILLGIGAKVVVLGIGAIFGLLFLAKKALIISILAFFMALAAGAGSKLGALGGLASSAAGAGGGLLGGLGGLGGLFGGGGGGGGGGAKNSIGSVGGPSGGWSSSSGGTGGWSSGGGAGGWSSGGGSGGWDSHGSYSSPIAQTVAYSGYKPSRR